MPDKIAIKKLDGSLEVREMNTEEQTIHNSFKEKMDNLKIELTNYNNKKASGKQKLLDLGLTEEEVKALIGI